jgi:alpha-tubulin suppressor-like RCC1 family protein
VTILHANAVGGGLTTELITNGGFESGTTGWVMVGPVVPTTSHYPHTGIGYAVMGEANNSADTMYQLITVPANATAATLSYWYNILSDEPGTTPYDSLNVSIRNTSGTVLSTVDIKWNTDKDAGPGNPYYRQKTFDLLPYRGQQVQILFLASTDSTNKSYFKIDDVSVLATVSPAASVTGLLISGPTSVAESSSASYTATAVFSDGSTSVVTPTSWSVTASSGSINASGLLMTNAVNTDTPTTVSASYTVGGATFNASTNITVVDVQVVVNNNLSVNKVGTGSGTITSSDSSISCGSTCIASYGNGTNMTLNAVPSNGSTFGSWAGCDSVNGTSCTVSMAFSRIVSVTFNQIVVTSYTVTTAPAGNGVGTITSAPGGSCISNTTCPGSYTLPAGTAVTISATAASGSVFAGWSAGYGSAYLCTGSSTCEFSLSEASTVNAIFVRQQFGLQLSLTGTGGGAVVSTPVGVNCTGGTCSSNFNSGTSVTLNATAAGGSVFAGWLGCPSAVGATCTIAMDMAQNVTATFNLTAVPTYGLSVVMNGAGGGNVVSASSGISCSTGTCSANFNVGSSVTLTATPSADSGFAGWSGGGCSGNGTCVASMNAAQRVIATFALISPPPTPTGLSAGGYNACAITSSGGVQCWGYKQITGTASDSAIPVAIGGLLGPVTAVSVGQTHACALTVAGAVQCWGFNGNGELGNGTTTTSAVPTLVTGLSSGVIGIAAGNLNGCAVKNTGAVVCWGHNGSGQLGTAAAGLVKSLTPVTINGLPSGVVKVVVGISHMCTLTGAGAVHCWGDNAYGTLGNGVFINSATPVAVSGLASGIVGLNASSAGGRHTCAVGNTGVVKCWGLNTYGQLGDGTAGAQSKSTPVTALGLPAGLSSVAAGNSHTCFMTGAGAVWCVGSNASGQLGNGTTIDSVTPVAVTGITSSSVLIAAGGGHTCAQASSGTVQCWGLNAQGQVGDGTKLNQLAPVSVSGLVLNATLPGAPIIGTVTGGNAQAVVNFTGPSGNGGAAVNLYTVTASPGGAITTGTTSPITVNGLTNGIAYAFTVAASNSVGLGATSAASNLVTPTGDLGQTISLAPPLTNVMVGGTGTLTVSGGASGNAVSLASATPAVCSVSNNLVTGHTAGSCTIVANQAGSANYLAAPQATLTFAVGKGSQSISLGAAPTVKVGATGTTSGLASSGLPVSYSSLTPTVCSVLPSAGVSATVKGLAAGSCVVAVNQGGDGNYNAAASVSMSISIGKASQTIIFGAVPTAFVGGTSTISATASSGLAVSYASTSPAICKVTGNTVAAVSAGSCVIVADQAGDANYMVAAQVSQNIAIGKASQTITFWAPPSLVAGRADTVLAAASSGLPVSYRSTTPTVCTLSGTSVLGLTPGNCSIAANQAGTADYSPATEATQSFVVGQGAQSITFGSAPALTVGATGTLSATGGSSGNEVIFTTTSADICTVSGVNGATVKGVAQGICIIAANQAGNTNYAAAVPATQSITVGQGFTQSISFAPGWNLLGNSLN